MNELTLSFFEGQKPRVTITKKHNIQHGRHIKTLGGELDKNISLDIDQSRSQLSFASLENPKKGAHSRNYHHSQGLAENSSNKETQGRRVRPKASLAEQDNNRSYTSKIIKRRGTKAHISGKFDKIVSYQKSSSEIRSPLYEYLNNYNFNSRKLKKQSTKLINQQGHLRKVGRQLTFRSNSVREKQVLQGEKVLGERNWEQDIEYVFRIVKELRQIGYSQKKINQWLVSYWSKRKRESTEIFMQVVKRKTLSNELVLEFERDVHNVKQRAIKYLSSVQGKERKLVIRDIKDFGHFVEEILIDKSGQNLREIKDSILSEKAFCKQHTFKEAEKSQATSAPQEIFHLNQDLKKLQERYGQLKLITKLSRIRFQQLTDSETQINKKG